MSAEVWYLDSSAIVKTVVTEPETGALLHWLPEREPLVTSELARVEVVRAVRGSDPGAVPRARKALATMTMIRLDDDLYDLASDLEPTTLRSLDAIHLASALSLGPDLAGLTTYDRRMTEAAAALGIRTEAPGC